MNNHEVNINFDACNERKKDNENEKRKNLENTPA